MWSFFDWLMRRKPRMRHYDEWVSQQPGHHTYEMYSAYRNRGLTGDGSMTLEEAHRRCNNHGKNRGRYK